MEVMIKLMEQDGVLTPHLAIATEAEGVFMITKQILTDTDKLHFLLDEMAKEAELYLLPDLIMHLSCPGIAVQNLLNNPPENFDGKDVYVLKNTCNLYGASLILNKKLMKNIGKLMKKDFYIIPSSIHEVLLMPVTEVVDVEYVKQMVQDVNMTLDQKDILSYNIFLCYKETGEFECLN